MTLGPWERRTRHAARAWSSLRHRLRSPSPRRLLVLCLGARRGGAEAFAVRAVQAAADAHWDTHLAAPQPLLDLLGPDFQSAGARRLHTLAPSTVGKTARLRHGLRTGRHAHRALTAANPEVAWIITPSPEFALGPVAACVRAGVPAVVCFQLVPDLLFVRFDVLALRHLVGIPGVELVAVSSSNAASLQHALAAPVHTIPNTALRPPLPPTERAHARATIRRELDLTDDAPLVVSMGRLEPQKGPELWADAARRVVHAHPHATLAWLGEGPLLPHLRAALADTPRARLLGFRSDAQRFWAAADVLALTSHYEGSPFVLHEAFAWGVPAVACDAPGVSEFVLAADGGWLTPPDDPVRFADTILHALAHPAQRRAHGDAAARWAANYTAQDAFARALDLLERARP